MNRNYFFLLPSILLICICFTACTGFENGPNVSFTKSTVKISNTWKVKEAVQHATDITPQYANDFWDFEADMDITVLDARRIVSLPPFTMDDTLEVLGRGTWDFLDSKNKIELLYTYNYQDPFDTDILYQEEVYEQWEITRLTDTEFWLRNDSTSLKLELFSE